LNVLQCKELLGAMFSSVKYCFKKNAKEQDGERKGREESMIFCTVKHK
jgi:hypothetical protein